MTHRVEEALQEDSVARAAFVPSSRFIQQAIGDRRAQVDSPVTTCHDINLSRHYARKPKTYVHTCHVAHSWVRAQREKTKRSPPRVGRATRSAVSAAPLAVASCWPFHSDRVKLLPTMVAVRAAPDALVNFSALNGLGRSPLPPLLFLHFPFSGLRDRPRSLCTVKFKDVHAEMASERRDKVLDLLRLPRWEGRGEMRASARVPSCLKGGGRRRLPRWPALNSAPTPRACWGRDTASKLQPGGRRLEPRLSTPSVKT